MIHMRDEELDLIAALAAGDLDPAAAAEAEALVARGGQAREEYEAQLLANAALADAGAARMTDLERARLRRAVTAEIIAPAAAGDMPRSLRWLRPLAIAAATVVVVGFGGLTLFNMGGGGDSAADEALSAIEITSAGGSTATSSAATESAPVAGADTEDTARTSNDRSLQSLEAAEDLVLPVDLGSVSSRDIDEEYLTFIYLGAAQYTIDDPGTLRDSLLSCAEAADELSNEPLLAFGTARYDGEDAEYFGFVSRRLVFLDADDCSLLGEHP